MKPKGLLIAVVLLAVLGGLTWWSNKNQADKAKTPADTATKLLTIPDDQFQEIKIKKVTDEATRPEARERQVADDRAQADGRRPGRRRLHGLHARQSQRR